MPQNFMAMTRVFHLKVRDAGGVAWQLRYPIAKDQLYVSPGGELTDAEGMACFDSEDLAQRFREAVLARLRARYGAGLGIAIEWEDLPVADRV